MKGAGRGRPRNSIKKDVLIGRRPLAEALPENLLEPFAFACPMHFLPDAREEFERLLPHMRRMGYEKAIYYANYCAMSEAFGFARAASKTITEANMLEVDEHGVTRKNPAFQIIKDQMVIYNTIASKFGCSPSDRAKISSEIEPAKKGGILAIINRANVRTA